MLESHANPNPEDHDHHHKEDQPLPHPQTHPIPEDGGGLQGKAGPFSMWAQLHAAQSTNTSSSTDANAMILALTRCPSASPPPV
jgi:hypothetical protein